MQHLLQSASPLQTDQTGPLVDSKDVERLPETKCDELVAIRLTHWSSYSNFVYSSQEPHSHQEKMGNYKACWQALLFGLGTRVPNPQDTHSHAKPKSKRAGQTLEAARRLQVSTPKITDPDWILVVIYPMDRFIHLSNNLGQTLVAQKVYSAIYPVYSMVCFVNNYLLGSDFSDG